MRNHLHLNPLHGNLCMAMGLLLLSVGASAQTQSAPAAPIVEWAPTEFPISYWCGPPLKGGFVTPERFEEIKEAGMTYIVPEGENRPTVADNLALLDTAHKVGMKAFIQDVRLPHSLSEPDAQQRIHAVIKDYAKHPALLGYFLKDEPPTSKFKGFGEVVAFMRQHDPGHPIFINLLPNYATPKQLEAANYEEYVTRFLDEVRPFVLCYDHYHFAMDKTTGQARDGVHFFPNLAIARRLAKARGIPFFQITLVTQHFSFRDLTEGEIRFEAMQTLAYGGKGLLWFTYWHPKSQSIQWSHAMINRDGTRNPHYYMVQRVNRELQALGKELLPAESLSVFHAGAASIAATQKVPGGVAPRAADEMVNVVGPGEVSVGTFKRGQNEHLALVANVDYKKPLQTRVFVASGAKRPHRFNLTTRTWENAKALAQIGGYAVDVELTPGGAALLKW